jgi:hypothetical protein
MVEGIIQSTVTSRAPAKEEAMRTTQALSVFLFVFLTLPVAIAQEPLGTGFTYQGRLMEGGAPAEGQYDFVFRLYDALAGGNQIGSDVVIDDWPVAGGLFTVELDFGVSAFLGEARWLDISVNGTPLSPRQPVKAAPYALYALDGPGAAGYWAGGGGNIHNTNTGNVGVGTNNPVDKFHVVGPVANIRVQNEADPGSYTLISDTGTALAFFEKYAATGYSLIDIDPVPLDGVSDATLRLFRHTNTSGPKRLLFHRGNNTTATSAAIGVDGADSYFQLNGGNLGIGTSTPNAKLTVDGLVSSLSGGYKFPDGTIQTTAATGGAGFWSSNGTHIYNNNDGNVGIGTSNPLSNLHVYELGSGSPSPAARIGLQWFQPMDLNDWFSIEVGGQGTGTGSSPRLVREAGTALLFQTEETMHSALRSTQMTLSADGKLGIGTTTPASLLEVESTTGVSGIRSTTTGIPIAAFRTSTTGTYPAIHAECASTASGATGLRSYLTSTSPGSGSAAIHGHNYGTNMNGYGVQGTHDGYGIGVYGVSVNGTGMYAKSTNGWALYAETLNGETAARFVGNVEILSRSTQEILIQFGEGLDYAEGFDVSDEREITPGTVLVIDREQTGQLAVSRVPYDRKVAGIVAGAQGLGSAVRIGAGQHDFDVALAGRVYCNVDGSHGAIEPGDLLTTSPTPGYAMKVTDHARAQGAILGKAMQPLKQGERGQILVLVTLQ